MAIQLSPAPSTLGIVAPVLGPWFSTSVTLPAPDLSNHLALRFDPGGASFLPPATGTLGLFVANPSSPPAPIAHLQDADGNWPFSSGQLVAYFRLLPEVEARLHELMRFVPPVTSSTLTSVPATPFAAPSRPRIRAFAFGLATSPAVSDVLGLFASVPGSDDGEKLQALGLAQGGSGVANGDIPMTWLRRPGKFDPQIGDTPQDVVLQNLSGSVDLWAFDARGRPVDAGAVAAWWSWLLTDVVGLDSSGASLQLLAPGIQTTDLPQNGSRRVLAAFAAARTAHLVDAHEGPLASPLLNGRFSAGGTAVSASLLDVTSSLAFSFDPLSTPTTTPTADNPQVDDLPLPRVAVLPDGNYGATATIWPSGAALIAGLERDFARVAALDEEAHLLGIARADSRQPDLATATAAQRRSSDQNRPSTRTLVSRTAGTAPVLLSSADQVAASFVAVFNATAPTRAVLGVADGAWGPTPEGLRQLTGTLTPLPTVLAQDDALGSASTYRVRALTGGGAAAEDRQEVLVELKLDPAHAGSWVRAWPLGFDLKTGLHFRLSGGGGRVDGTGAARLVMTLANGRVDTAGLLSMDMEISREDQSGGLDHRAYADRRFSRPAPAGGSPASAGSLSAWAICETGQTGSGALPSASVPSGATVVTTGTPPSIVDRTTIPQAALRADALSRSTHSGDMVSLTQPACQSTPDRADNLGRPLPSSSTTFDPTGGLGTGGVIVHRLGRSLGSSVTASSAPYNLQDRLEVVAASVRTGGTPSASAVIGGAPPVPWVHETLPHFLGHPGAPAAIEQHGTGVSLDGPPALAVAEYTRERTAGLSFPFIQSAPEPARSIAAQSEIALAAEAATPLPSLTAGTGAGPVVAVLRTGPVGQEGFPGVAVAATTVNLPALSPPAPAYPLSQTVLQAESALSTWLDGIGNQLGAGTLGQQLRQQIPSSVSTVLDSLTRALDRRIRASAYGSREAALALAAAFQRAQDLIYIETPALDGLVHGPDDDTLDLWSALATRMGQRKGLHVLVCVPTLLAPGTPRALQAVRDAALLDALDQMKPVTDRFAAFSPGTGAGRSLRLATTTVVVDDAFALTGTTHLWRRGLTFDSSLAAAVFDERVVDGRPQEVRAFRIQLLADRLGMPVTRVPADPGELVRAVRAFDDRGSVRLSATSIKRPDTPPTSDDQGTWNPDGARSDVTASTLVQKLTAALALTDTDHAIVEG